MTPTAKAKAAPLRTKSAANKIVTKKRSGKKPTAKKSIERKSTARKSATARDNFSPDTRTRLASRAGYRCSHPNCRVLTIGPSRESPVALASVGVAAHISAAAEDGPRWRAEMTADDRASIENGIWLCQTHARLIDRDVARFNVEVLREMRGDMRSSSRSASAQRRFAQRRHFLTVRRSVTPRHESSSLGMRVGSTRCSRSFFEKRSRRRGLVRGRCGIASPRNGPSCYPRRVDRGDSQLCQRVVVAGGVALAADER